jgi:chromate transporter
MKFAEFILSYLRSGLYSFGASANEVLHEQLVMKRRYLTDAEYLHLMSLGALVPGPFHVNLVIATGYHIAGFRGALGAAGAFILPGFSLAVAAITSLQVLLATGLPAQFSRVTSGMLAAVAGLVLSVVIKLARKNLTSVVEKILAIGIASALFYWHLPFFAVILAGGWIFLLLALCRLRKER